MEALRGTLTKKQLKKALSHFRFIESNKEILELYFVKGVRLKDLPCSRQQAWNRIKKVSEVL